MSKPQSFVELIETWPEAGGLTPRQTFGRDLGLSNLHVNTMRNRNQVATAHWPALLKAARKRSLAITYEDLLAFREAAQAPHRFPTILQRAKRGQKSLKMHA